MSVDGIYILYEIETWFSYVVVPAENEAAFVGYVESGEFKGSVTGDLVGEVIEGEYEGGT